MPNGGSTMPTSDDLRALTKQSRQRVDQIEHLRAEQRLISAQTAQRLRESRLLLDRASVRERQAWRPPGV